MFLNILFEKFLLHKTIYTILLKNVLKTFFQLKNLKKNIKKQLLKRFYQKFIKKNYLKKFLKKCI